MKGNGMEFTGAVIGFGGMGKVHVQGMRDVGIRVVAVCDSDPRQFYPADPNRRIESWQGGHEGELPELTGVHCYTDYEELFAHEAPTIVSIATWSREHVPAGLAAVNCLDVQGIFCEKPLSNSASDGRLLVSECSNNGILLAVNHERRWWRKHREVQEFIKSGVLGPVRGVYISCGGARLGDIAPHFVDWCRWMVGSEIYHVVGYLDPITDPNPRDPDGVHGFRDYPGYIHLAFENGVRAAIDLSQGVAIAPEYHIVCAYGRISIREYRDTSGNFRAQVDIQARGDRVRKDIVAARDYYEHNGVLEQIFLEGSDSGTYAGPDSWLASALNNLIVVIEEAAELLSCSGEDGYKAVEAVIAAHISHSLDNCPVGVPLSSHFLQNQKYILMCA